MWKYLTNKINCVYNTVVVEINSWGWKKVRANDVAKWFLNTNDYMQTVTDTEFITNMKLQKLLYYAQAYYLAKYNKPLFREKILAWEHGPVVKEVYDEYKKFGGNGIIYTGEVINFSPEIEQFLLKIYELYGQYSAWKLRNMTHSETPWKSTPINCEIKHQKMINYFRENDKLQSM